VVIRVTKGVKHGQPTEADLGVGKGRGTKRLSVTGWLKK